jgi:hypothetical protein
MNARLPIGVASRHGSDLAADGQPLQVPSTERSGTCWFLRVALVAHLVVSAAKQALSASVVEERARLESLMSKTRRLNEREHYTLAAKEATNEAANRL